MYLRHIQLTSSCIFDRLLSEVDGALNSLPSTWLAQLLQRMRAGGQSRDNIVRRSAGLPFAFTALFLAEPPTSHRVRLQPHIPLMEQQLLAYRCQQIRILSTCHASAWQKSFVFPHHWHIGHAGTVDANLAGELKLLLYKLSILPQHCTCRL